MAKVTVEVTASEEKSLKPLFLISVDDNGDESTETVKQWLQRYVDNTADGQDNGKRMADFEAFTDEEKDSAITAEKARQ